MSIRQAGPTRRPRTEPDIKICYLGNSVTAQRHSYVDELHPLLVERWTAEPRPIKAGLGGVGSLACSGLLDYLVLRHEPDVCFIECSLADAQGASPRVLVADALSSILADLVELGTVPIFLHMPRFDDAVADSSVVDGTYRDLAARYGAMAIDLRGDGDPSDYPDGIHPTQRGARAIAKAIASALSGTQPTPVSHRATTESTRIRFLAAPTTDLPIGTRRERFKLTLPTLRVDAPTEIVFTARDAEILGIYAIADAECGVVRFAGSRGAVDVQLWDPWCSVARIQFVALAGLSHPGASMSITPTEASSAPRDAQGHPSPHTHAGVSLAILGAAVRTTIDDVRTSLGRSRAPWWAAP